MILLTRLNTENDRLVMKSIQLYFHKLYYRERFEPRSDLVENNRPGERTIIGFVANTITA